MRSGRDDERATMSNVVMMGRTTRIVARVVVGIAIVAVVGPLLWVIRVALRPQALFATGDDWVDITLRDTGGPSVVGPQRGTGRPEAGAGAA